MIDGAPVLRFDEYCPIHGPPNPCAGCGRCEAEAAAREVRFVDADGCPVVEWKDRIWRVNGRVPVIDWLTIGIRRRLCRAFACYARNASIDLWFRFGGSFRTAEIAFEVGG